MRRAGFLVVMFGLCVLMGQQTTTSNGIPNQQSNAGISYSVVGSADTGGLVTLRTATGFESYSIVVGGYVTAFTGTGGSGELIVNCGSGPQAANIAAPTGMAVEQFTTAGSGAIPLVTSCYLKSGDTVTYEFDATVNAMSTITQRYTVSVLRVQ